MLAESSFRTDLPLIKANEANLPLTASGCGVDIVALSMIRSSALACAPAIRGILTNDRDLLEVTTESLLNGTGACSTFVMILGY